jgi:methylmalonyl-CoA/ethylmalonyl-CoA epimerase
MKHLDHIGIAVKDLQSSVKLFEKIMNTNCYKTETVGSELVNTAFLQSGETKIELLKSRSDGSDHEIFKISW